MRIKSCILVLLLLYGTYSFAKDAIIRSNYSSNENSVIEFSNHRNRTIQPIKYDSQMSEYALKEIQQKIKQDPYNYALYVNLANIYLKSRMYNEAFDSLFVIYNAKKQGNLNTEVRSLLDNLLSELIRLNHKSGNLYLNLALIALIQDNNKAFDYSIAGIERSNDIELTSKLLNLLIESDIDNKKAIVVCDRLLINNPNNAIARKIRAISYEKNNQQNEAISDYTKVLSLNSKDDDTRYRLYKLLAQSNNIDDKEMIKKLYGMIIPFNSEEAYISITELLLRNGDYGDAKSYAEILIKKYNQNPNSYLLMSEIYKKEGKIKEAYDILKIARDKADDNKTIGKYNVMLAKLSDEPVREAKNLIESGLYSQALEVLESANPEALQVILTQAKANYFAGDKNQAFDLLNKAMSLYSDNSDVYSMFGNIYFMENDMQTARSYIERSLQFNNNNQEAQVTLAMINKKEAANYTQNIVDAMEEQNFTEAMRLVNEAMSIDDKSADLYYYKSLIYISMNNYAAATATLYKCIELKRNYKEAYFYLGVAFDNLREKENALSYYKKYLELVKGNELGESERIDYAKARISKIEK